MGLPSQPVIVKPDQIGMLNKKLASLRHDVNNNLSLIIAAVEISRRRPESAERMWNGLAEKPHAISEALTKFSLDFEETLGITRP